MIALNATGSERAGLEPFGPLFRRAKDAGLRSVPHAGEWAGPENVWETLEHYLPDRIGHGVRAAEDPALVEHLARTRIPLEVSPVSNVAPACTQRSRSIRSGCSATPASSSR
ncbi:MAG TPA: hypothetical protein VFZ75_04295 [Actinomycetota bacterium]|nr:hypothetical protein [Actinomycetota bacterium]